MADNTKKKRLASDVFRGASQNFTDSKGRADLVGIFSGLTDMIRGGFDPSIRQQLADRGSQPFRTGESAIRATDAGTGQTQAQTRGIDIANTINQTGFNQAQDARSGFSSLYGESPELARLRAERVGQQAGALTLGELQELRAKGQPISGPGLQLYGISQGQQEAQRGRDFQGQQAGLDRSQQTSMQERQIGAAEREARRGRKFQGREASLDRTQRSDLQQRQLDAAAQEAANQRFFTSGENAQDRGFRTDLFNRGQQADERRALMAAGLPFFDREMLMGQQFLGPGAREGAGNFLKAAFPDVPGIENLYGGGGQAGANPAAGIDAEAAGVLGVSPEGGTISPWAQFGLDMNPLSPTAGNNINQVIEMVRQLSGKQGGQPQPGPVRKSGPLPPPDRAINPQLKGASPGFSLPVGGFPAPSTMPSTYSTDPGLRFPETNSRLSEMPGDFNKALQKFLEDLGGAMIWPDY